MLEHRAVQEHHRDRPRNSRRRRRRAGRLCLAGCRHRSCSAFGSGRHPRLGGSEECGSCRDIGVPGCRPNSRRGRLSPKPIPQRNHRRSGCPSIVRPIRYGHSRIRGADAVRSGPDITRTRPSAPRLNRHRKGSGQATCLHRSLACGHEYSEGTRVPADDIFILLLVIVCVAIVVGAAVHSRRKHQSADQSEAQALRQLGTMEPPLTEPVASRNAARRKRRKR